MANTERGKADTIAHHFYTKLCCVVHDARSTQPSTTTKPDKWFNLEMNSVSDSELFSRETQRLYKNISDITPPGPPPLQVQVLLSVPELANNQALVYISPENQRVRIEPTPNLVVLETWTLALQAHTADEGMPLPTIYKHGIPLFRSLYALLRILPAWKLHKRLRRSNMTIQVRVASDLESQTSAPRILSLDASPSPTHPTPFPTSTHAFPPVPHPLGSLVLSGSYLSSPNFQLDELESLLSSRFISLDHQGFVPTLVKNQQRDSITGSSLPGSASTRQQQQPPSSGGSGLAHALLSRSPPKSITRAVSLASGAGMNATGSTGGQHQSSGSRDYDSLAERFILPSRITTPASIGSSASTGTSALIPPPRPFPSTTSTTTPSTTTPLNPSSTSSSNSPLTYTRIQRDSLNSSSSSSLIRDALPPLATGGLSSVSSSPSSATPGGVPIRRPSINPVPNLFKSNTVAAASAASVPPSGVAVPGTPGGGSMSASPSLSTRHGFGGGGSAAGSGGGVGGISGSPLSQGIAYHSHSHSRQASTSASPASIVSGRGGVGSAQTPSYNVPPSPVGAGFASGGGVPSSFGEKESLLQHHRKPGTSGSIGSDKERPDRRTSVSSNASGVVGLGIAGASAGGGDGDEPSKPRKRYSSSFGKYQAAAAAAAAGSVNPPSSTVGTPALGGLSGRSTPATLDKEGDVDVVPPSPINPSDPSSNPMYTEDDINVFVQDLDSAKPLSGRFKEQRDQHPRPSPLSNLPPHSPHPHTGTTDRPYHHHERYKTDATDSTDSTVRPSHFRHYSTSGNPSSTTPSVPSPLSPSRGLPTSATSSPTTNTFAVPGSGLRSGSPARPAGTSAQGADSNAASSAAAAAASTSPTRVVNSQGEADERLRLMNENFLKSLEGMGSGSSSGNSGRRKSSVSSLGQAGVTTSSSPSSHSSNDSPSAAGKPQETTNTSGNRLGDDSIRRTPLSTASTGTTSNPLSHYHHLHDGSSTSSGLSGMGRRQVSSTSTMSLGSIGGSTSGTGAIGSSQGSEEVIGKMDFYAAGDDASGNSGGGGGLARRGSRR